MPKIQRVDSRERPSAERTQEVYRLYLYEKEVVVAMQTIDVIIWCALVGLVCYRIGFWVGVWVMTRKEKDDG
jgi:hypothetical protein